MGTQPDKTQPLLETLRAFFAAMRTWELACTARHSCAKRGEIPYPEANRQDLDELKAVHRQFCTTWEKPFRAGTFPIGGEYDPEGEKVLEVRVEGELATVHTETTTARPNRNYIYRLKETAEGWRLIDERQWLDRNGVPQPGYL